MTRGYFGIGIESGKTPDNIGGLWRSAHAFGAAMIFTVGHRYPARCQPTDTSKAARHIPLLSHANIDAFLATVPEGCELVGVECGQGDPRPLPAFSHPERALYVLGAEDRGLDSALLAACDRLIQIPSQLCLNVATAGSIVLYDRVAKAEA